VHPLIGKKILRNTVIVTGFIAAILYSSWPLGYFLNPIIARQDYASELESAHQPYNWLFIGLDILTGLVLVILGVIQWRRTNRITFKMSIVGYELFAILVIAAAVAPFNCNSITQNCVALAAQPAFIIHGFSSIFSVVFLFASLVLLCKVLYERHAKKLLYAVGGVVVLWGLTGVLALYQLEVHVKSNLVQYIFITICSVSIALAIGLIDYMTKDIEKAVNKIDFGD
jgi:uncharacterized membrane protein YecN with MAPEG domain